MSKKNQFFKELLIKRGKKIPVLRSELKQLATSIGASKYTFYDWMKEGLKDGYPLGGWHAIQIGIDKRFQSGRRDTIYFPKDSYNEVLPVINNVYPESNLKKIASTINKLKKGGIKNVD